MISGQERQGIRSVLDACLETIIIVILMVQQCYVSIIYVRSGEKMYMLNINNADYVLGYAHTCVMVLSKMAEDGISGRRIVE